MKNSQDLELDSLCAVFRTLSSRRQSGLLTATLEERSLVLVFHEGKICGVEESNVQRSIEIARRLVTAGFLSPKILDVLIQKTVTREQLYELLVGKKYVSHDEFVRATRAYELDALYAIRNADSGTLEFQPKLIRVDSRFSLALWPCQVLLDLEEFAYDEQKVERALGKIETLCLEPTREALTATPGEVAERIILEKSNGVTWISDLLEKSLLSQYEALEAILSLHEQELVSIDVGRQAAEPMYSENIDIDDFDVMLFPEEDLDNLGEATSQAIQSAPEPVPRDGQEKEQDQKNQVYQAEATTGSERTNYNPGIFSEGVSLGVWLSTPAGVQTSVISLTLVFLVLLGFSSLEMFDAWFKSISELLEVF